LKKIFAFVFGIIFILCGNLFLTSCGESNDDGGGEFVEDLSSYFDSTLPSGTLELSHSIMSVEDFDRIIPLGQINPPGHTFPTDHIYFVLTGLDRTIYAPTGGKVLYIEETGLYGDGAIRIGVTSTMSYYLGHVFVSEDLQVGDMVEAGDEIAMSGNTSCVDLGVINKDIDNGFLSEKYPAVTLYGDKPLSYYNEPLRTQLYEMVCPLQPSNDPDFVYDEEVTDGEFAIDELGTLCGNWLLEGCFDSQSWYEWTDTLAFGYDVYYPDQIRIGIGTYSNAFALNKEDNPVRPEDVTVSSGAVAYYLYNANNVSNEVFMTSREKLMMVQMLSDTRIKIEIFDDTTSVSRAFTSGALYYVR